MKLTNCAVILPTLLLTTHAGLLLVSSRLQFPTRNEVAHVPAGLSCWHTGRFGLYSVNPPLWKMLATIPTLCLSPRVDGIEAPSAPRLRTEWGVAQRFANDNVTHYFSIMWSARLAGILWSVLGGVVVYRWARELNDMGGGLLALTLWCFGPNVLAHAQLATPDIPATVAGIAATYFYWRYLKAGTWSLTFLCGMLLGVAQLTKFTMLILYAVWPVLAVAHSLNRSNQLFRAVSTSLRLLQGGILVLLSVCIINLGYGFDGSLLPLGQYEFVSQTFTGNAPEDPTDDAVLATGNRFRGTWLGKIPMPFPRDYLTGLDLQRRDLEGTDMQPSYLAGEWRQGGWWYYYLYGLAVKVPLATWGLALWGLVLAFYRLTQTSSWADELTLWLPAIAVLSLTSSQTGYNHHLRYVLPMAPFVCVATGKLAGYIRRKTWKIGVIVLTLLGWSVVSSLAVYPHSLSYFNELVGGPNRGHKHLADSNIDWAQDLYFFKTWADGRPEARPLGLVYYHSIDYRVCGAEYDRVPSDPRPGWYGVDVYNMLSPKRPYRYFQHLTPVAKAGYSIFIYHITPEEANRVRKEMGFPPLADPRAAQCE